MTFGTETSCRRASPAPLAPAPGDRFGGTLAAAPVQLQSRDIELAIGAPLVDVGAPSITNTGAVNVLYRRHDAPAFIAHGAQESTRNSPGVPDDARAEDRFGR
jgi:hypothetical protein